MHSHFAEPTLNIAGGFWRFLEVELQRWVGSPWLMRVSPATVEREKRSHYPPKPPCSSPPENVKCQLGGNAKKAFKWNALPIYVFTELLSLGWVLSIELWIDFVFSMWSRLFCIRCWRDVTERAKACPGQQKLFLYAETIESGVNNRVKRGKWEEKNFR